MALFHGTYWLKIFENGLRKETKILVETNFRSFVFILTFKNIASSYTLC